MTDWYSLLILSISLKTDRRGIHEIQCRVSPNVLVPGEYRVSIGGLFETPHYASWRRSLCEVDCSRYCLFARLYVQHCRKASRPFATFVGHEDSMRTKRPWGEYLASPVSLVAFISIDGELLCEIA